MVGIVRWMSRRKKRRRRRRGEGGGGGEGERGGGGRRKEERDGEREEDGERGRWREEDGERKMERGRWRERASLIGEQWQNIPPSIAVRLTEVLMENLELSYQCSQRYLRMKSSSRQGLPFHTVAVPVVRRSESTLSQNVEKLTTQINRKEEIVS